LIRELKSLKASDVRFRAKFSVLSELVKHHIEEEESEMLPKAEESGIDWKELEMYVMKKREQLMRRPKSDRSGGRGRGRKMSSRNRRK
jgi:hypothetical protein